MNSRHNRTRKKGAIIVLSAVMMVMMIVRPQGLLPFRLLRFKESDVRRAEGSP